MPRVCTYRKLSVKNKLVKSTFIQKSFDSSYRVERLSLLSSSRNFIPSMEFHEVSRILYVCFMFLLSWILCTTEFLYIKKYTAWSILIFDEELFIFNVISKELYNILPGLILTWKKSYVKFYGIVWKGQVLVFNLLRTSRIFCPKSCNIFLVLSILKYNPGKANNKFITSQ